MQPSGAGGNMYWPIDPQVSMYTVLLLVGTRFSKGQALFTYQKYFISDEFLFVCDKILRQSSVSKKNSRISTPKKKF